MLDKKQGKHEDYEMVHIRVQVCRTKDGLLTHHQPESDLDEELLTTWKSGGMAQVAAALLNEGVKREIYLALFSDLSQEGKISDIEFLKDKVSRAILKMTSEAIDKMTPVVVQAFDQDQDYSR